MGKRTKVEKVYSILSGLTKTPLTAKDRRGLEAEDKAFKAAEYWRKKKIILSVKRTEGFSPEDREGKDLILALGDGKELFIDVKDYCNFEAVQKCKERGVYLFTIWPNENEEIAKEKMLNLIISAYISNFKLIQIRQLISKILEIKNLPSLPEKPNLIRKIFSRFKILSKSKNVSI